jgi:transcriptional regulator with XRE-family HTH domain
MELSFEIPPPPPPPAPPKVFADHWTKVGAGIKQLRKARGLTQAQLAELIGVERTSITNVEKGQQRLGLDLLDKLAAALGMKLTMRLEPLDGPTQADALESVFFTTPMCWLRFNPNDDDAEPVPDEQIKQAIQADRLKLLTRIKELSSTNGVNACAKESGNG